MSPITLSAQTGLTIAYQLYKDAVQVSRGSLTDIGTTGEYYGNFPSASSAGKYLVVFFNGVVKITSAVIFWDGTAEIVAGYVAPDSAEDIAHAVRVDLDAELTQIGTLPTLADIEASTVLAKQATVEALTDKVDALPADVWAQDIEVGATAKQSLMLSNSVLGGRVSGAGTGTETFSSLDGTKDRVVSVNDSTGNRTEVTLDLT